MDSSYVDKFGPLPLPLAVQHECCRVEPLPDFNETLKALKNAQHRNGFLYPPSSQQYAVDPITGKIQKPIPKTQRPMLLFKLPPTHQIVISGQSDDVQTIRKGMAGFVIHLLAYLTGVRVQFHDWWFSGRIPIRPSPPGYVSSSVAQHFFEVALEEWKSWSLQIRRIFTNALFIHTWVPSYEWEWERFMVEYMVTDALWKVSSQLRNLGPCSHSERIIKLCEEYNLYRDDARVQAVVGLRNDLFHEALWNGNTPGFGSSASAFQAVYDLRRLNDRLIPAILRYSTNFVSTNWRSLSRFSFGGDA